MDLKLYYQKIRETEANIPEDHTVVVSRETPDGGKDGVHTEVPRHLAAKMAVEGSARMATPEEIREYREIQAERRRVTEQMLAASKVQLAVMSTEELNKLKGAGKPAKGKE